MYFVPLAGGYWKTFASPLDSFWCCCGTGVESFAKLGDSIYFHDRDSLWVNLFIASELNWPEKGSVAPAGDPFSRAAGNDAAVLGQTAGRVDAAAANPLLGHARRCAEIERHAARRGRRAGQLRGDSPHLAGRRPPVAGNADESAPGNPAGRREHGGDLVRPDRPGRLPGRSVAAGTSQPQHGPGRPAGGGSARFRSTATTSRLRSSPRAGPWSFASRAKDADVTLVPFYSLIGKRYAVYWKI